MAKGVHKIPSFPFYPGDWRKDPELNACSKAAKGVWIDLMCFLWEAPQRGKLTGTWADFANLLGLPEPTARALIQELVDHRVPTLVTHRHNKVTLMSRRFIRMEKERINAANRQNEARKRKRDQGGVTPESRPSHGNVTPMFTPSSSSLTGEEGEAAHAAAPAPADPVSLMDAAAEIKAALRTSTAPRWIVEDIEAAMARTPGLMLGTLVNRIRSKASEFAGQPARTCIETLWPCQPAPRAKPSQIDMIAEINRKPLPPRKKADPNGRA